ncbi:MAG TPA: PQQ-binding-like beta-propeller repeat protein [Kofleriaceae bacterium]|nr:PQQ-binding-like beta-propeller repeat protein [Kofleriaceae bacterium]
MVSSLLVAGAFAGCASNGSSKSPGTGDDDSAPPAQDDGDVPFTNGTSTLAGMADAGYVDGARKGAQFSDPVNVVYKDGVVYVADFDNGKLRAIDADTHVTTTIISQATFKRPFGLAFAADGTLFVSTDNDQAGNHTPMSGTIWRVDLAKKTATVVANAVGRPRGMAVLADGRIAAADYLHHVVEIIDPGTGKATTIAGAWDGPGMVDGAGTTAKFSAPYSVGIRADGKLIVTDFDNNRIRLVGMDGTTSTLSGTSVAGFVDGAMATAQFSHPQGMSIATNGDIYITDLGNFRVRRIVGNTVETVAGNGMGGYADNDSPLMSQIYGLEGLSVVPDGSMVYVADGNRGDPVPYNRVRQVKLTP